MAGAGAAAVSAAAVAGSTAVGLLSDTFSDEGLTVCAVSMVVEGTGSAMAANSEGKCRLKYKTARDVKQRPECRGNKGANYAKGRMETRPR